MCGIAGVLGSRIADHSAAASAMAEALVHRGPDGSGMFACQGAALAHRRLAIIDPAGGRQPIGNEDGSIQVVCNGEIYNYRELRAELQSLGHRFATGSDCEAIVHAYEEWGDDCLIRLRGMFALAVLDTRRKRLLLARDHLGIKPVFWQSAAGGFAFASELRALRRAGLPGWRPDRAAIDLYLRLQYIPSPLTAWKEAHRLPPAHRLVVAFDGSHGEPERYWDCPYTPRERPDAEIIGELTEAVDSSVRSHLVSDVPFGVLLSGGLDSAGIAASLARAVHGPATFTVGAAGDAGDERGAAKRLAAHIGAVHRDGTVEIDPLAELPGLLDAHGQPFGDDSAIPTALVARLARQDVKMVLSGDGGDELFAGYGSYTGWLAWLSGAGSPAWRRAGRRIAGLLDADRFPPRAATAEAWAWTNRIFDPGARRALWRKDARPATAELPAGFRIPEADGIPPLALAQRLDLRTYLPDCILAKVDAASMAHGLEVRTPLVDRQVVEYAMGIPCARNLERHGSGLRGKRLWRTVVAPRAPAGYVDAPKRGFAAPLAAWCEAHGATGTEIRRRIADRASPLRTWFADDQLARVSSTGTDRQLWLLVVLDAWLRREGG